MAGPSFVLPSPCAIAATRRSRVARTHDTAKIWRRRTLLTLGDRKFSSSRAAPSCAMQRAPSPSSSPSRNHGGVQPGVEVAESPLSSPLSSMGGDVPAVVFVLGGPGSGKGTQCERLSAEFGFAQLCVGELLRREVATGSALGEMVAGIMQAGGIVPGGVTMELLGRELRQLQGQARVVLIDGFPRAVDQASEFQHTVTTPRFVLFFHCRPDTMVQRLRHRASSSDRPDDDEAVFRSRLATFDQVTMPVVQSFRADGLLRQVDAEIGSPDDVYARTRPLFVDLLRQLDAEDSSDPELDRPPPTQNTPRTETSRFYKPGKKSRAEAERNKTEPNRES